MNVEINGITILFIKGKNEHDNTLIVNEADENDIWFHVADMPSSHIIAKIHNLKLTKKQYKSIIKRGAKITKMTSKYSANSSLHITYTEIKNVKVTNTPGLVKLIKYKNITI